MYAPTRRRLALFVLATLVVTAGCTGATTFEASPATVPESTVSDTEYAFAGTESREVTRQSGGRNVTVVNQVSTYERAVDLPGIGSERIAAVVAVSTPSVQILGTEYNPVADASLGEVADRVAAERERLRVGDRTGERQVTTLGTETTLARFDGETRLGPTGVDTTVHVLEIAHGSDYVVVVAAYPSGLDDEATVVRFVEALDHR